MFPKKYMVHVALLIACGVLIFSSIRSQIPETEKEEAAQMVAARFFQSVDAGEYVKCWDFSAQVMKEKVTQEEWVDLLTRARQQFGPLVERKQKDIYYAKEAKGLSDGEFIVIKYETNFKQRQGVVENLTVMFEKDGNWRVAGFHYSNE